MAGDGNSDLRTAGRPAAPKPKPAAPKPAVAPRAREAKSEGLRLTPAGPPPTPQDPTLGARKGRADRQKAETARHAAEIPTLDTTRYSPGARSQDPEDARWAEEKLAVSAEVRQKAIAALPPADAAAYQRLEAKLSPDPLARVALEGLLFSPRWQADPGYRHTLFSNLDALATGPRAKDLQGWTVLAQTVREVHNPLNVHQEGAKTCAAAAPQIHLVHRDPAEYVRLVTGLVSPEGKATTRGGAVLQRVRNSETAKWDDERTASSRVFQAAAMDLANGANQYDYLDDTSYKTGPGSHHEDLGAGLSPAEQAVLMTALMGKPHAALAHEAIEGGKAALAGHVDTQLIYGHGPIQAHLDWGGKDKKGQYHAGHAVLVTKMDAKTVTFANPWGRENTLSREEFTKRLRAIVEPGARSGGRVAPSSTAKASSPASTPAHQVEPRPKYGKMALTADIGRSAADKGDKHGVDEATARVKAMEPLVSKRLAALPKDEQAAFNRIRTCMTTPLSQEALYDMFLDGGLSGAQGKSLLKALGAVPHQATSPGVDAKELTRNLVRELADPTSINQQQINACAAGTPQLILAMTDPARYVRIIAGLAGPTRKAEIGPGKWLDVPPGDFAENDGRTLSSRLFQAAGMEYAMAHAPDKRLRGHYDPGHDSRQLLDGSLASTGKDFWGNDVPMRGLTGPENALLSEALLGVPYANVGVEASTREALAKLANDELKTHPFVQTQIMWTNENGETFGHEVLVTSMRKSGVTFKNTMGEVDHMTLEDFVSRLENVTYRAPGAQVPVAKAR